MTRLSSRLTGSRQGHLAMLGFSMLVAGSFALGSLVANDIAPVAFTTLRMWLAAAVLGIAALATGQMTRSAAAAPWRFFVLAAIMAYYFVSMFEGLKTAPPVSTSAVFTLSPILSAGFGYILMRQRLTRRMALALAVGGVGALWVIFRADVAALLAFDIGRGELIFFTGCAGHAFYTPLVARLKRGEPTIVFAFGTVLAGAILMSLIAVPDLIAIRWGALSGVVWATVAYTAIFATAGSFALLQFAATQLPSAKVMAYTYLTPTWVIVWQWALGNPVPGPLVLVGVALTVAALWLLLRDEEPQKLRASMGTT